MTQKNRAPDNPKENAPEKMRVTPLQRESIVALEKIYRDKLDQRDSIAGQLKKENSLEVAEVKATRLKNTFAMLQELEKMTAVS